ncbi:1-deoxy-D-xylulose-5-phosphate synthase [Lentisphaerota bacterium ZTH]|nr:1-deoxy-D-xylulose-5-phosphate synthase [Lentisphaerota bacterium]WET07329.1 1-deoxy-D-xylulose-5-phosphate synthase [Lentisphaerota bacterium ZTH]
MSRKDTILSTVNSPEDLKKLSLDELKKLAVEIRKLIIDTVASEGGHLAPNLGVVELTIALHRVFDSPHDKLVWDVGHQGYVHKLLTGRKEFFKTLRKYKGCLGFLSREESDYDCFGAGHAGTAISAALGMAAAADLKGSGEKIVAVVGDGSLNCGISLEGLNNISGTSQNMTIILNDNKMSISENVGAIPSYLNRIITAKRYNKIKAFARKLLLKVPKHQKIRRAIQRLEEATKSIFLPGVFFEELGIRYIGPIDGHDLREMIRAFDAVKDSNRPVLVHVCTEKGRGYTPAEEAPEKFHGLSAFDPATGKSNGKGGLTFSKAFGNSAVELAETYSDVTAITAAMAKGTGLSNFAQTFPDRFYDVGIAEEHAVVFAAGLAASGLRPVVAMYATFMQRALDCVFHDVCLQNLPVIFCLDRAGIVEDGPTHHGIHDLGFFRSLPNLILMSPQHEAELRDMIFSAYELKCPVVIRYPRGKSGLIDELPQTPPGRIETGKAEVVHPGSDGVIWSVGREVQTAMKVAQNLEKAGIFIKVVNTRFLRPFDAGALLEDAAKMPVFTLEDCVITGGLASEVDEVLVHTSHHGTKHFGWSKEIVPHGCTSKIRDSLNMSTERIAEQIKLFLNR